MRRMDEAIEQGEAAYFCHVSVHGLMLARDDPQMAASLERADLALPDGMPVVWALRALGERISDRVYGPTLMELYCERCAEAGRSIWLYGGANEAALDSLRAALAARFPSLRIAGSFSPPFRPLDEAEEADLVARINADGPDVVWCGLGAPKQELWMARMRDRLEAPALSGVGAAFDFLSGRVAQAPPWMGRNGLEWLHRMSREPRRLGPRYLRHNPRFLAAFARQLADERRPGR
ncbi:MAG: glycosyltransferase [Solirubrobacterales bacterium]|nr:glycosyltransferase [Solirubrobacterales bacterium]